MGLSVHVAAPPPCVCGLQLQRMHLVAVVVTDVLSMRAGHGSRVAAKAVHVAPAVQAQPLVAVTATAA